MTKLSKVIIVFCLCISLGLMGVGVWLIFTPDNTAVAPNPNQQTVNTQPVQNQQPTDSTQQPPVVIPDANANQQTQTQPQAQTQTQTPNGQAPSSNTNVSSMTSQQLLDKLASAVNSTKSSTANVNVHHVESIDINITQCPMESIVKPVITPIINKFTAPEEETIQFTGGKGTNGEGKAVTLACFPPVDKQFTLTMAGVQSITGTQNGANSVITVKLKPENTTVASPVPANNAASIGYLNLATIDLPSAVKINSGTFNYTGSTIVATINANGNLTNIKYTLPMVVSIVGKVSVTPELTIGFTGEQHEEWTFNW